MTKNQDVIIEGQANCLWVVTKDKVKLVQTVTGKIESRTLFELSMSQKQFFTVVNGVQVAVSDLDPAQDQPPKKPKSQIKKPAVTKQKAKKSRGKAALDYITGKTE